MHRYPIRVGVLLALTLCANPAARATGAGAYPMPDYRGPAFGQAGAAPAQGSQPSGYSVPAYGQPGSVPGGGRQSSGYAGSGDGQPVPGFAAGGGYQAPGYSGPAGGANGVPGASAPGGSAAGQQGGRPVGTAADAGLGYGYTPLNSAFQGGYGTGSGQAPGPAGADRDQQPRRAGGNRFNPMKTLPDPVRTIRGNRNH